MVFFAYLVARFGVEHFNKVFAIVTLATGLVYAIAVRMLNLDTLLGGNIFSFSGYSALYWGGILVVSALFLFFARFVSHFIVFGLIATLFLLLARAVGIDDGPVLSLVILAGSVAITFLLRRHTVKVLVGMVSGLYLSVLISSVLNYIYTGTMLGLYLNLNFQQMVGATTTFFVMSAVNPLIMMGLGIAVQYLWYEKFFGVRSTAKATP